MHKYHIYGLGAALVDTEIEVSDHDLQNYNIDKGIMTLVDEARQHELMAHLADHLVWLDGDNLPRRDWRDGRHLGG